MDFNHEIHRRRTFAIVSHPDAGKTTLTEKLLLYGELYSLQVRLLPEKGTQNGFRLAGDRA